MSETTNEVFDLTSFNDDGFSTAKPLVKFDPMKDGQMQNQNVNLQINSIWLKKSDEGKMSLNVSAVALGGTQTGATVYKRINITKGNATSFRYLKTDLVTLGIKTDDLNDLNKEEVRKLAEGKVIASSIVVNPKDTRFYDVKFQREVTA